ncbi:MAG: ATP-binding protein [Gammaproteobacteria bacterium]|nr:ATP-binding protein [Gammaproteobacteria bacterium]
MIAAADKTPRAYSPSKDNLRNLLLIRGIALLGQTAVLAYVLLVSRTTQSLLGVTLSLCVLAAITAASLWRTTRPWPVADREFLAQLLVDVIGWTALMYFTGGANNPFISYYIVPVVIAAAVLPWRYTWLVALASMLAYSLLLYVYQPFPLFTPHSAMGHGDGANVHILGMWFNFLFSVGLITYFVVRMAAILRREEEEAARRREARLQNDQIMAVASLAAGTAHQLGTPLSAMTVLVEEMRHAQQQDSALQADCELLQSQLEQCKQTLSELSRTAEFTSVQETRKLPVEDFARQTLQRWAVRRPGTNYRFECAANSPIIETDTTLSQAIENLLNNAADSGSPELAMSVNWDANQVHIAIRDWGPGVAPELIENLGKPMLHAHRSGLGIGLMLSQATVERYGGTIELRNMPDGGVLAAVSLPITVAGTQGSS